MAERVRPSILLSIKMLTRESGGKICPPIGWAFLFLPQSGFTHAEPGLVTEMKRFGQQLLYPVERKMQTIDRNKLSIS